MKLLPLAAFERAAAALAALYCSVSIALGAYAVHAAAAEAVQRLERASLYLLLHGVAVIALTSRNSPSVGNRLACAALLLGTALFAGSLSAAALAGWPARLAPAGGLMLIIGWVLAAIALGRRGSQA